jgi:cathepsin F
MNTKLLIAFALIALVVADKDTFIFNQFQKFIKEHNKKYTNIDEYMARYNTFKKNYEKLETMTISPDSKVSHSVGLNKFADLSFEEFRRTYLNAKISPVHLQRTSKPTFLTYLADVPESFDWRDKKAVGPVKDQGRCGSCFAFSAVGNLEGLHAIKTGEFVQYSEQQLVDCDKLDMDCLGGFVENAFEYIKKAGGIELQVDYPYTAVGGTCSFVAEKAALKITGFEVKNDMNEEEMKAYLVNTGPLAIFINANPLIFYSTGIIYADSSECNPEDLNHFVVLVGYGIENGKDFWIIKNSWGEEWGEDGYFRITRNRGTCGVNKHVSTAKLE